MCYTLLTLEIILKMKKSNVKVMLTLARRKLMKLIKIMHKGEKTRRKRSQGRRLRLL